MESGGEAAPRGTQMEPVGRSADDALRSSTAATTRCAVLGAVQWRVYQSGPQRAAKLSHLQSVLPRGDSTVLGEINKLVRKVYRRTPPCGSSI